MLGLFRQEVFAGAAQKKLFEHGTIVLAYHKIGPVPRGTRDPFLYTSAENFQEHLDTVHGLGCRVIELEEIMERQVKAHTMVITFDDGFENVHKNALPILVRKKIASIQFIVAGLIGGVNEWDVAKGDVRQRLMDDFQIKEWLQAGQTIGSHSWSHKNLKKLPVEEAREEITRSKKYLEDRFGVKVKHFCYPYGGLNERVRELVKEAGYETACAMNFGVANMATERYALRRITPYSSGELTRKVFHRAARVFRRPGRR